MRINDNCIDCRKCMDYCPVDAIKVVNKRVYIAEDECVECGVCKASGVCPTDALFQPDLDYPRVVRSEFSNPVVSHAHGSTDLGGRGTAEMKTNDVTGRFKEDEAGVALEVGRPGVGTRLWEVEKIYKEIVRFGAEFEADNPVKALVADHKTGNFKKELLDQKVLSAIIEFKVPTDRLPDLLKLLDKISQGTTTIFSVCLVDKVSADGSMRNADIAKNLGYSVSLNGKFNVGLGRPRARVS